ncbi:hypothetical protein RCL1_002732 [Eukaryota sp. TZLM3-RCL]
MKRLSKCISSDEDELPPRIRKALTLEESDDDEEFIGHKKHQTYSDSASHSEQDSDVDESSSEEEVSLTSMYRLADLASPRKSRVKTAMDFGEAFYHFVEYVIYATLFPRDLDDMDEETLDLYEECFERIVQDCVSFASQMGSNSWNRDFMQNLKQFCFIEAQSTPKESFEAECYACHRELTNESQFRLQTCGPALKPLSFRTFKNNLIHLKSRINWSSTGWQYCGPECIKMAVKYHRLYFFPYYVASIVFLNRGNIDRKTVQDGIEDDFVNDFLKEFHELKEKHKVQNGFRDTNYFYSNIPEY